MLGMTFLTACNDFLDEQKPQGTVDNELLKDPQYVDNLIIPAYALWISAEDINSPFTIWNYVFRADVPSKERKAPEHGHVCHPFAV